ncbi:hypothetical protein T265_11591 [Opisthorchis viverrini]|uniref:Peptidase A1 domain-containing protein n=1 Tax=Opisthorchis viverrini TaxID=6198 RepID=A0A074YY58_OPIVI|nr:hypothetical protein T265_11591 [Opisthorchis viverrini]KER19711.1 hypothetical protein T265_11591 [Opisthorchis viverrini]
MYKYFHVILLIGTSVVFGDKFIETPLKYCGPGLPCGDIAIGTPPQTMTVLFDSGSCHTWIRSVNSGTVFTSVPYDFRESSTYEPLAKTFSETYAACRISGRYMKEAITVAQFYCVHFTTQPVQIGEVMVQGVILAEAFEQSGACSQTRPFDGIFGLCLSSKTPETEPTIFEQLYKHGTFDTAVFSIWFKP